MRKRLGKEKVPYTTVRRHYAKPAGSKCLISRPDMCLVLEFEDGEVIELEPRYYAIGLEEPNDPLGVLEEDRRFYEALEASARETDQEVGYALAK